MTRLIFTIVSATALAWSAAGYAAHCPGKRQIASAAHQLDEEAAHFHDVIHYETGYSHFANDVHELSTEAGHFHDTVELGATCRHVRRDFRALENQYNHVRQQLMRAHRAHHNRHIIQDWFEVSHAFRNLQRTVFRYVGHGGGGHGGGGHGGGGHGGGGYGGGGHGGGGYGGGGYGGGGHGGGGYGGHY